MPGGLPGRGGMGGFGIDRYISLQYFPCHDHHRKYNHAYLKLQLSLAGKISAAIFKRARRFSGKSADQKIP